METRTVLEAKRLGIVSCSGDDLLCKIVMRMADDDISALVVVDEAGYLCGIITRSNVLRARQSTPDWCDEPVRKHMTQDVVTVDPETKLIQVLDLLQNHRIHRIVVVRDEEGRKRPISVLSDSDLVIEMAAEVEDCPAG